MSIRSSILIVDKKGTVSNQLSKELRNQGYHTICVREVDTILPLIESMDRVYTMVYVDENLSLETVQENLNILKQLGPKVPIVFTTEENDLSKEKAVREKGVFFYHVKDEGMKELITAVVCAMEEAVKKDRFIPGFDDQ